MPNFEFEIYSDAVFGNYPDASFDDPEQVKLIVGNIEERFANDPEARDQLYTHGLHKLSFGVGNNGEYHQRHPLLAVAMFKGIASTLDVVAEEDRKFVLHYALITTIQVCTEGDRTSRDYEGALALVRELYPLPSRQPTDGMNEYESWILDNCSDERGSIAVLPEAATVFADILLVELAAISAGKSIMSVTEETAERLVTDDQAGVTSENLVDEGATDIIIIDNGDSTLNQIYRTGKLSFRVPILELACLARSVLPELDIIGMVISHPEFSALEEMDQLQILKEFVGSAMESGDQAMIEEMLEAIDRQSSVLSTMLRLELEFS